MKHFPVTQIVCRPLSRKVRGRDTSCVRFPRAASADAALAQLIAMHVPSEWR